MPKKPIQIPEGADALLSMQQAAVILGCSYQSIRKARLDGISFPMRHIPGVGLRVRRRELDEWIDAQEVA